MASEPVKDLEEALGRLLLRSNRVRLLNAALRAAPESVDRGTYAVLSGLGRLGPTTSAALAVEIGVDRTGASRYADRLVKAGLLSRQPDPRDGRASLLVLTDSGHQAVDAIRTALMDYLADLTAKLQDSELRALVTGLRLLADPVAGDTTGCGPRSDEAEQAVR